MDERIRIGNRIKELRQKRGLSTYKLAEMTGLNQPNICRIEAGRYSTGIDILAKIASALRCRLDFIEWYTPSELAETLEKEGVRALEIPFDKMDEEMLEWAEWADKKRSEINLKPT